jgi:Arc/MetJ-type ribon-helix-helix transcriptional regulator
MIYLSTSGEPNMNIALDPTLERLVDDIMRSGRYRSPMEVVNRALLLMRELQGDLDLQPKEVHRLISEGLDSVGHEGTVDGDAVFDRLEAELDRLEGRERH